MPTLRITGQIGDQTHEVCCDDDDMTGSLQVTNWLLMELGAQPYALETIRVLLPRLPRLFGSTMQVREEDEATPAPEPEGIPAPADAPRPEDPTPEGPGEPEPGEEPAEHALREQ